MTVQLRNGAQELLSLVKVVMITLMELFHCDRLLLVHLLKKCRDNSFNLPADSASKLIESRLIADNHQVHRSIRNIVLSCLKLEGTDLSMQSPLQD